MAVVAGPGRVWRHGRELRLVADSRLGIVQTSAAICLDRGSVVQRLPYSCLGLLPAVVRQRGDRRPRHPVPGEDVAAPGIRTRASRSLSTLRSAVRASQCAVQQPGREIQCRYDFAVAVAVDGVRVFRGARGAERGGALAVRRPAWRHRRCVNARQVLLGRPPDGALHHLGYDARRTPLVPHRRPLCGVDDFRSAADSTRAVGSSRELSLPLLLRHQDRRRRECRAHRGLPALGRLLSAALVGGVADSANAVRRPP